MKIETTHIEGLKIITPRVFTDARGYFMESYNHGQLHKQLNVNFVQDNESMSSKGVLRGLHFQREPYAQAKLVRVIQGAVIDVAVDIRPNSPTFGKHFCIELNDKNKKQFFIPTGFAHGFVVLKDDTIFAYKCSEYYHPETEATLLWNDSELNIDWGIENPIISDKDKQGLLLKDLKL
jgi:dTDP-4-dehydrorhamnose 3,5-epimerase